MGDIDLGYEVNNLVQKLSFERVGNDDLLISDFYEAVMRSTGCGIKEAIDVLNEVLNVGLLIRRRL